MFRKGFAGMVLMIFLSMILLGGCGTAQSSNGSQGNGGNGQNGGSGGIAAGNIQTWITVKQKGKDMYFTFHLKNQTKHVKTFHFMTGQRFDYIIKNEQGDKIKQYSHNQMFTQMVGQQKLKQAEELTYKDKVSGLSPGKYTITFWLTAKSEQPKATKTFEVK